MAWKVFLIFIATFPATCFANKYSAPYQCSESAIKSQSIEDGDVAYGKQNYDQAMSLYKSALNDDSVKIRGAAQDRIGTLIQQGKGAKQDFTEALSWFHKAADLDNPDAYTSIGDAYQYGYGVPKNIVEAKRWYQQGADKGSCLGLNQLAWIYLNGLGVGQNPGLARSLYQRSAALGSVDGQAQLGWSFVHQPPIDYIEGMKWYLKAVSNGDSLAANNIGYLHENGLGVPRSYELAANWYRISAEAGQPRAQYHLGNLYNLGYGVQKNPTEARAWMNKAAKSGDADAINWLSSH